MRNDPATTQLNPAQMERLASLGQMAAGIAHDIRNPLNFINNFASLSIDLMAELIEAAAPGFAALPAGRRAEVDELVTALTANLEKIATHGKRAEALAAAILDQARGGTGRRRPVDLNRVMEEAIELAIGAARARDRNFDVALERDFSPGMPPVDADPDDLVRVFLNLFQNGLLAAGERARDDTPPGYRAMLRVVTRDLGHGVEIRVRDNGAGIPDGIRGKLFQPFFTTRPAGEGTGLGLAIVYDIITNQYGGTIAVESEPGDHTTFVICLPRTEQVSSETKPSGA